MGSLILNRSWLEQYFLSRSEVASYGNTGVLAPHILIFFLLIPKKIRRILFRGWEARVEDFNFQVSNETVKEGEHSKIRFHPSFSLKSVTLLDNLPY